MKMCRGSGTPLYLPTTADEEQVGLDELTPREIISELDKYVGGQHAAKRAVAIALRNRIQTDPLPKNRTREIVAKNPDAGDIWLWVAVDADSKLVPSWMLGPRDFATAKEFIADLASRQKLEQDEAVGDPAYEYKYHSVAEAVCLPKSK